MLKPVLTTLVLSRALDGPDAKSWKLGEYGRPEARFLALISFSEREQVEPSLLQPLTHLSIGGSVSYEWRLYVPFKGNRLVGRKPN